MTDLKISQLPAAAALTGAEKIELVQSGDNVQSTAAALGTFVASTVPPGTPAALNSGGVSPAVASSNLWLQNWQFLVWNGQTAGIPNPAAGSAYGTSPAIWATGGGAMGTFPDNPAAGSVWLAQSRVRGVSAAAINSPQEIYNNNDNAYGISYRKVSASPLIAGFNLIWIGSFSLTKSDQVMFVGWCPHVPGQALGGSFVPSATLNMVGFGKDTGDVNIQFMSNNGAGTATKTDTGVTMASIQAHMVRIAVGCDPAGAVITATLQDLEVGGVTKTYTLLDAAAKNIVADQKVTPHIHVNTGPTTATSVELGVSSVFAQYSFIQ